MVKAKRQAKKSDPAGHEADSPWRIPRTGWKQIARRTWQQTWIDNVGLVAAGVAFYGFLAFVPLLAAIILVYGLLANIGTVIDTMQTLFRVLPTDIAKLLGEQVVGIVHTSQGKKGIGLVIALAIALYGASNGAGAIITALNIAYEQRETRPLWKYYVVALVITLGAILAALIALAAAAIVATLGDFVPNAAPGVILLGKAAAYLVMTLAGAAIAATLYRFAPCRAHARWVWITPGSIFTAAVWLLLTLAFGFYVGKVANYAATYGSLAAVAGLLTWMYLSAYAFVFGAELNREIEHQTAKDSTTGRPRAMGTRGAWAADHVASDDKPKARKAKPKVSDRKA
ncbi:MAG: rane protein [Sphingomonadales bacterium]|nr:rane protein [Sphingomonadales bacterium]